jgi:hypothetical protein
MNTQREFPKSCCSAFPVIVREHITVMAFLKERAKNLGVPGRVEEERV